MGESCVLACSRVSADEEVGVESIQAEGRRRDEDADNDKIACF